jgi:hypothetical protein
VWRGLVREKLSPDQHTLRVSVNVHASMLGRVAERILLTGYADLQAAVNAANEENSSDF